MTDYGRQITFGLSLYPSVDLIEETKKLAHVADAAGLEYLAIQDHAYNPDFLDVWTLITYLAAETERISFFPDVEDLQLRPPTILAKAAASLSVLTGGRIALGVGGGASAAGIAAMGRRPAQRTRDGRVHRRTPADPASGSGGWRSRVPRHPAHVATRRGRCPRRPFGSLLGGNGPRMLAQRTLG
jgi:alkanesulfonate monooxygenase SsuD/methylene tetrahydromethanopterin reductase-like flavin-dependent oxidoreductase (luciferase family)